MYLAESVLMNFGRTRAAKYVAIVLSAFRGAKSYLNDASYSVSVFIPLLRDLWECLGTFLIYFNTAVSWK
jgi:hypothetical protein